MITILLSEVEVLPIEELMPWMRHVQLHPHVQRFAQHPEEYTGNAQAAMRSHVKHCGMCGKEFASHGGTLVKRSA